MAGPNGWISAAFVDQQQDQQQQQGGQQQGTGQTSFAAIPMNRQQARNQRAGTINAQLRMMAKARGMSVEAMMGPALRDTANAGGNGSAIFSLRMEVVNKIKKLEIQLFIVSIRMGYVRSRARMKIITLHVIKKVKRSLSIFLLENGGMPEVMVVKEHILV